MPMKDDGYLTFGHERPSFFARCARWMRYLAALFLLPISLFTFWPPYHEEKAQSEVVKQLKQKRDELQAHADTQTKKLDLIRNDPEYLEVMARDRLQLQKEGETIVRFEKE